MITTSRYDITNLISFILAWLYTTIEQYVCDSGQLARDNWRHTSIASISYDGMTSHCDVMTRRCDRLAAACKNTIDDLFDSNNPHWHRICIGITVWLNYKNNECCRVMLSIDVTSWRDVMTWYHLTSTWTLTFSKWAYRRTMESWTESSF